MLLSPSQYDSTSTYDLLQEAARGYLPLDQRVLRAILDRGEAAVPELLRFGLEDHADDRVDLEEDLLAIFRFRKTNEALPYYLKCARTEHEDISDELVEAFAGVGAAAIEPLLALYEEIGEEEGGEVAFLLASLRERDSRILELLQDRLDFDLGDGAFLLGLYGDPAAKAILQDRLEEIQAAGDASAASLKREIERAIEDIENPMPAADAEAFDIWSLYPETAVPEFETLEVEERLEFLASPAAEYRARAVDSFALKELEPRVRDRLFDLAQNDESPKVRASCWEALADSLEVKEVREAMQARLLEESAPLEERCGALVGLAFQGDSPDIARVMKAFYEIPAARAKALEAMRRSMELDFAKYFPKHLDDGDLEIRRQAIWGVGHLAIHSESARLRKFFEDEDLRPDALYAYSLAVPGETSLVRMPRLFHKIEELAGGLSLEESYLVKSALNDRLERHGLPHAFFTELGEEPEDVWKEPPAGEAKAGRNDPCPCGSGKKYKKCCGA